MEEISQESFNKTTKEANLQKLREEFNKKSFNSDHPKTSYKYKRSLDHSSNTFNSSKKYARTNKALSANKFNLKWGNGYNYNDKQALDFYRKHPGYLYYKEIVTNMKSKNVNKKRTFTGKDINKKIKLNMKSKNVNKKRTFTGKDINKKIKLGSTNYSNYNNGKNSDKLPKIGKVKKKQKNHYVKNYIYNFNYNNYNYSHNHNYNYNINNININIKDKNNPYSLSWVNRILSQNDYRLEIKQKSNGIPKLVTLNKKSEIINKIYNNNKLYINNYVKDEKEKKEENDKKENEKDKDNEMQFYKNQKNFFKARKDIKEEPEDLEEDKEEDKNKEKNENDNDIDKNKELKENQV